MTKNFTNWGPLFRGLVVNGEARHYERLKGAIYLLLYFVASVHHKSGILVTDFPTISQEMGIKEATIRTWAGHLCKKGYIQLRQLNGEVHVKVTKWRQVLPTEGYCLFRSSNNKLNNNRKPMPNLEPKKKAHPLALEISQAFAEEERLDFYEALFDEYPEKLIKKAYERTLLVPSIAIKKSRPALFVYLLKKYAQNQEG